MLAHDQLNALQALLKAQKTPEQLELAECFARTLFSPEQEEMLAVLRSNPNQIIDLETGAQRRVINYSGRFSGHYTNSDGAEE
jgi:hypothetical protein